VQKTEKQRLLALHREGGFLVNLAGNYDYLELPYYVSLDLENMGQTIYPTCKEMLDAYITPLFLEKAKLAGLSTPEYYISNGYFEPPVIIDPINPFMIKSRTVHHTSKRDTVAKSMTRNFTYAICCQDLPEGAQIKKFRSVLGWCSTPKYREAARQIWDYFHIPLAVVRTVVKTDGSLLLSDISQLPFERLKKRELAYVEEQVQWVD
jgi:hypothetical protein